MDEALALLSRFAGQLIADGEDLAQAARLAQTAKAEGGASGVSALMSLARLVGEASDASAFAEAAVLEEPEETLAKVALLVASCFAAVRADYPARPDAVGARQRIAAAADALYSELGVAGHDAVDFISRLAGATVLSLSSIAASRAPLVRVETAVSLPSTLIAFDLYGDPSRAAELVARNKAATPMVMPGVIEALAV